MILAPHRSGEAPAVNVARFVSGFAVLAEALRVKWGGVHGEVWPNAINPGGSVPPAEDDGVTVNRPFWLAWSTVVVTADVFRDASGEKAFKALFGACRHMV
jgi:hypothetical protein